MNRSKYSLAHHPEARQRALWLIRDYPHIKARLDQIDGYGSGGGNDGQPRARNPKSPVEGLAIKRAALADQLQYTIPQGQYPGDYWTLATGLGDDIIADKLDNASDEELLATLQTFQDTCISYVD